MLYRKLGKSGIHASVIALGTWAMGGWQWGGCNESESIKAIEASIDNGINLIDTAPIYGFGLSEEIVGKAIKNKRDKVVLATKCGLRWDLEKGNFYFYTDEKSIVQDSSKMKVYIYLHPTSIREEIERSLKRLQSDYIDLYQTHRQDSTTAIEDTMAELLRLKDEGKIRAIGVSNANREQMKRYGVIDTDQEKYNMLQRDVEEEGNIKYCLENDIAFLAYSPLAQGILTGKISLERKYNDGDVRLHHPLYKKENLDKINKMLDQFNPIAEKYNATLGQLVSAWTFSRSGVTHLLIGARNAEQAEENACAGSIKLEQEDIDLIDLIYYRYF